MIQIFTGNAGPGAHALLDDMHRDRKRVFVDLLKWAVPVIDGAFEVDQFDTERAVYLIAANGVEHLGSFRLLPTDGPHVLGSIFSDLCDGPVPCGSSIWEISRGCLSPRLRAVDRLRVRNRLISAAVEFATLRAITVFTCIADSGWLQQIPTLGWACEALGKPRPIAGVNTGALRIPISGRTIDELRTGRIYTPAGLLAEPVPSALAA